jgi:anti-anti-sigma regulatory factor
MELTFKIEKNGDSDHIFLTGKINEEAEVTLADLLGQINGNIIFNFGGVKMVNSCGVRAWINFLRDASKDKEVIFEECTPEIVGQINMIPNFLGNGKIKSVYADYACESCENSEWKLFEEGKNLPETEDDLEIEEAKCSKCGAEMEMEELEDEFFAFVSA